MLTAFAQSASPLREPEREQVFPWQVLHACDRPHDILGLVEGQLSIGMRPQILTVDGMMRPQDILAGTDDARDGVSLLSAWNHVRIWRKLLGEADQMRSMEAVHAHVFSAGMAAVRAGICPVYDVSAFIDAGSMPGHGDDKSWLARSFRVAEQFILARAGAVVVHTPSMKMEAFRRGAAEDTVFVVPDPIDPEWFVDNGASENTPVILAPAVANHEAAALCATLSRLRQHVSNAKLLLVAEGSPALQLFAATRGCEAAEGVEVHPVSELPALLAVADVVIVNSGDQTESHANPTLLRAMAAGTAVLAADAPSNRNVSAEGEGVLWVSPELPPDEMARHILYLLQDARLRQRLGSEAKHYVQRTRTRAVVARQYDEIYRAVVRKRRERTVPPLSSVPLQPAFGKL